MVARIKGAVSQLVHSSVLKAAGNLSLEHVTHTPGELDGKGGGGVDTLTGMMNTHI